MHKLEVMFTDTIYRIVGDITIKNKSPTDGRRKIDISYGNKKTTNFDKVAIIQARQPLTPDAPYFLIEVQKCGKILCTNSIKNKHMFRSECNIICWYCTVRS
jgi:hypothetical protein